MINAGARWLAPLLASAAFAAAQTVQLSPVEVTASRSLEAPDPGIFSSEVFGPAELRNAPGISLDDALRADPAFSLFRRTDSLVAHPTTQGVSLRGVGPSGASRTLVVLDGVPLNDPFGGWVQWEKLPRETLQSVEIDSGGGATAWGNSALGGVIALTTRSPRESDGVVAVTLGDFATRSAEWSANEVRGATTLEFSGQFFSTDGYHLVAPESAGPVDVAAASRHQWFSGRWVQSLSPDVSASLTVRYFNEHRDNGTPYQVNASREEFISGEVDAHPSETFNWRLVAYAQQEAFSSTFSSVSADRSTETPASNQYDVPADADGAAWTGSWTAPDHSQTLFGADARHVRGESREDLTYSSGHYTKGRVAGGAQTIAGLFVLQQREFATGLSGSAGLRLDNWSDYDGHRQERDLTSGALTRDDRDARRDGWEWSPSASLAWRPNEAWRWTLSGQQAFRRPTLNELYRPFRVGNIITEANPALGTERVETVEAGAETKLGNFSGSVHVFDNELHGAVSAVTVAQGGGNVPGFGFIPAGGSGKLRENLNLVRVRGVQVDGRWKLQENLDLTIAGLFDDARVVRATTAPNLVGLRVAEVPRFSGTVGLAWRWQGWELAPQGRYIGAQFDDDQNQLRLAPAWVMDVTLSKALVRGIEVYLSIDNLFNERIETSRSATNVVNVGEPRFATGGVKWRW